MRKPPGCHVPVASQGCGFRAVPTPSPRNGRDACDAASGQGHHFWGEERPRGAPGWSLEQSRPLLCLTDRKSPGQATCAGDAGTLSPRGASQGHRHEVVRPCDLGREQAAPSLSHLQNQMNCTTCSVWCGFFLEPAHPGPGPGPSREGLCSHGQVVPTLESG